MRKNLLETEAQAGRLTHHSADLIELGLTWLEGLSDLEISMEPEDTWKSGVANVVRTCMNETIRDLHRSGANAEIEANVRREYGLFQDRILSTIRGE